MDASSLPLIVIPNCKPKYYYHGTTEERLISIAVYGLQPREWLEARNEEISFPNYSAYNYVYVTKTMSQARYWAKIAREYSVDDNRGRVVVLRIRNLVDAEVDFHFRNLSDKEGYRQHLGSIPSTQIDVRNSVSKKWVELPTYVGKVISGQSS